MKNQSQSYYRYTLHSIRKEIFFPKDFGIPEFPIPHAFLTNKTRIKTRCETPPNTLPSPSSSLLSP